MRLPWSGRSWGRRAGPSRRWSAVPSRVPRPRWASGFGRRSTPRWPAGLQLEVRRAVDRQRKLDQIAVELPQAIGKLIKVVPTDVGRLVVGDMGLSTDVVGAEGAAQVLHPVPVGIVGGRQRDQADQPV